MPDENEDLLRRCKVYAEELNAGPSVQWARNYDFDLGEIEDDDADPEDLDSYENRPTAYDWLNKHEYARQYVVDGDGDYVGGRVMVSGGGPTIWVETDSDQIVGTWWSNPVRVPFHDAWDLDEALSESWEARS